MKFMLHMNVPKGPYQMTGWSPAEVKAMVGFMHQVNADLKAKGQWVTGEGLVGPEPDQDRSRRRSGAGRR